MSYLKIGNAGWSIKDTGFGNRIQFWEIAYELNKFNDFKFTILDRASQNFFFAKLFLLPSQNRA